MAGSPQFGDHKYELTGGAFCLDFANTGPDQKAPETRAEKFEKYPDLLSWAVQSGELTVQDARSLSVAANHLPLRANAVLRKARELRQAIYEIFSAIAGGRAPATKDLDTLNNYWKAASVHRTLTHSGGSFRTAWTMDDKDEMERPLWPVAASAAELLTSEELASVRECASDQCSWLFLDNSRNRTRRWCDMKVCGNREKARRHYERAKG